MKKNELIVYSVIIIYSTSYWIQTNSLPIILKNLSVSTNVYGYLGTLFGVLQLLGSPIFGRFGDLFGSKQALIASLISCVLSYFILFLSYDVHFLYLSRIPFIFMHTMQAGQMIITDTSSNEDRSRMLGYLGVCYGIGMIVGNLIGGYIVTHLGPFISPLISTILSVFAIILVQIKLPYIKKTVNSNKEKDDKDQRVVIDWRVYIELLKNRKVAHLITIKILTAAPLGILQSVFLIILVEIFDASAKTSGFVMGYIGCVSMIVQGVGLTFLTKIVSDRYLILASFPILFVGYAILGVTANSLPMFIISITVLVIGQTIQSIVMSSSLTHSVDMTQTGVVLGMNMSVHSIIRIVSPTVGVIILHSLSDKFVGLGSTGAAIIAATAGLVINRFLEIN